MPIFNIQGFQQEFSGWQQTAFRDVNENTTGEARLSLEVDSRNLGKYCEYLEEKGVHVCCFQSHYNGDGCLSLTNFIQPLKKEEKRDKEGDLMLRMEELVHNACRAGLLGNNRQIGTLLDC